MEEDISFGAWLKRRRRQLDMTQKELAYRAGCSLGTIRKMEADERRPSRQLAALLAQQLDIPQEEQQSFITFARAEAYQADVAVPIPSPIDEPSPPIPKQTSAPNIDRHEAPDIPTFFGRGQELTQLESWIVEERCRLVAIVGIGGQGKTSLAAKLTHHLADGLRPPPFEQILWRSLLNAPPLSDLLPEILQFLSRQQLARMPADLDRRLDLLLELLRQQRCLLVLDNAESLLQEGSDAGALRQGYEDYGQLFLRVMQYSHQSCLLLTSREAPQAFRRLAQDNPQVQLLNLGGLSAEDGRQLLQQHGLATADTPLIERYSGNPLALKLVADTIENLFFGDVGAFLADETLIFDDIRAVLQQQVDRLSDLERDILFWLAIEREPLSPEALWQDLLQPESRRVFLEALRALQRRSLLEKSGRGFTLQNVVTEYLTERWVDQVCQAIEGGQVEGFNRHALLKAQAKPHIRQSQRRLILGPVARRLAARMGQAGLEKGLAGMRDAMRAEMGARPGYAGGNMLNLLMHLGGDLRGADFSGLVVWQAYMQGKNLRDINFREADLSGALLTETFDNVMALVISPDGDLMAAGTANGQIVVWRLADGFPLLAFDSHISMLWSICFSPDGRILAGAGSRTVAIWDARSGQTLAKMQELGPGNGPRSISFSPDGRILATGHNNANVYLWDVQPALSSGSGRPIQQLSGHSHRVQSIAFSPDGKILASGSVDSTVGIWELGSEQPLAKLDGHSGGVWAVAFSPDGSLLASGGEDHTVQLWQVAAMVKAGDGQPIQTLQGHTDWVRSLSFHPEGAMLASAAEDQSVRLWDVPSGQVLSILHGHTRKKVNAVCFHPDGDLLASGGEDQTVRLWDVAPSREGARIGRSIKTFQGYANRIWSIDFSPDGKILASGGANRRVWLWDLAHLSPLANLDRGQSRDRLEAGQPFKALAGHSDEIHSVCFSPDGEIVASGSWDHTVMLWGARTGHLLKTLRGHTSDVWMIRFSPDGATLASAGNDHTIRIWDVQTGQIRSIFSGHTDNIFSLAYNPDGHALASVSSDRTIRIWDIGSGRLLNTMRGFPGICTDLCFSPDGAFLAGGFYDGAVRLWRYAGPESLRADQVSRTFWGHSSNVATIAFSPDGRQLASSAWTEDRTICLWDIHSPGGKEVHRSRHILEGHTKNILQVAFSPTGKILASCDSGGMIRLWDVNEGKALKLLRLDRPYERMDITDVTGLTGAQKDSMKALGAVESDRQ